MKPVFLDHNATTFPSKRVLEFVKSFQNWGNPSSIHSSGRKAQALTLKARRSFASQMGCEPGEVIFTSGGSESNNMVLKGVLSKMKDRRQDTILATSVEHPSVVKSLEQIKDLGFKVKFIPVSAKEGLDYNFLEESLHQNKVGLVTTMFANNETGEIFDLKKIESLVRLKETPLYWHSDMVQALGKASVSLKDFDLDFASFSAHKFYSLQGTGVLYQKKRRLLKPLIAGGGQEKGRRAGTENLLSISAFGEQLEELENLPEILKRIEALRDYFEEELKNQLSGVQVMAENRLRVPNTSLLLIEGVHGETMLINLDLQGFEISTGAACSSGNPEPSPVLLAMGLSPQEASKSLRVSLGWQTTKEEIDLFLEALASTVKKIRSL